MTRAPSAVQKLLTADYRPPVTAPNVGANPLTNAPPQFMLQQARRAGTAARGGSALLAFLRAAR